MPGAYSQDQMLDEVFGSGAGVNRGAIRNSRKPVNADQDALAETSVLIRLIKN